MKEEYDFASMESRSNPYAARLKKPVTIRLDEEILSYFKAMSTDTGIPYQSLINLYLQDCVNQQRRIDITWQQEK
ncbi:BrnA antitoxin family protein [Aliamphritea hakodatensis]|uniref:BrnA antitoxin family protein n=1 Tax=Aliamphritea hakodatensis TaxID=2895352 RepID=UPI0022FD7AE8|nr:BrnA antitoxin family protein [Aliamphritea hakodatensis]